MSPLTKAKALGMAPGAWEPRSVSSHLNLVHHTAAQPAKCYLGFCGWHEPLCWGRQQWVRNPFVTCGTSLTLRAALWGPHSLRGHRVLSQDIAVGLTPRPFPPPHTPYLISTRRLQPHSARRIVSGPLGKCSAATLSTPRTPSSWCGSSPTRGVESRPSRLCNAPVSNGAASVRRYPSHSDHNHRHASSTVAMSTTVAAGPTHSPESTQHPNSTSLGL